MFKLGTLKIPHRKHTAEMESLCIPTPATVVLPLSQHIGAPATPVVKVGDKVFVGTKIAEADGKISSSVHSSVSGTVKKIGDFLLNNGNTCQAITIESDGEMTTDPGITPPTINSAQDFCAALRESGLVGLGGAGFPTYFKAEGATGRYIDKIVINAAECEPYITSDNRTMLDETDHIVKGILLIEKYIPGNQEIIIGIEKNKPKAIAKLTEAIKSIPNARVDVLPSTYPQGAEKTLIYNTTGRIVPEGKLPFDAGCLVMNVSSVAFVSKYVETGMPLVKKLVTVDGSAVRKPCNVFAPIGTSLRDILSFAETDFEDLGKVIYGGPMMGIAAYDLDAPIFKTTGALVAFNKADALPKKQYPCLHCGKCITYCPMGLDPTAFTRAMSIEDKSARAAALTEASVLSCIDCGCCSYVCPSRRPLAENNKLAKSDLKKLQAANN